jgi:DNA-binding NtrC family response regulator
VDVRVVAATNRRLSDEVTAGRFRQDLFFRLNVLHIDIPPLRERLEDVAVLARAFLAEAEERIGRTGLALSEAALEVLAAHPWPGNVRELRNVMMRAVAVAPAAVIEPAHLKLSQLHRGGGAPAPPPSGKPHEAATAAAPSPPRIPPSAPEARDDAGAGEADGPGRDELVSALDACGWNIARTATTLGVSRMTLYRRLRKFGITR